MAAAAAGIDQRVAAGPLPSACGKQTAFSHFTPSMQEDAAELIGSLLTPTKTAG